MKAAKALESKSSLGESPERIRRSGRAAGFCLMTMHRLLRITGCFLSWVLFLAWYRAYAGDLEIMGSVPFSNQVHQAMALLKAQDAEAYAIVTNYVGRIREGEPSGMWAYSTPPTYQMSDTNAFYSVTWCAATIAHDSFHSKLYHDYHPKAGRGVPDAAWTGTEAERRCMKHQLGVMRRIGAPRGELEHARRQADGHYVKDGETWQDYRSRKW